MDRHRYALILGPIVGLILAYVLFSAMSDRISADQDALLELGPVTMQEVVQNPSLLAGIEAEEAEAEAVAEGETETIVVGGEEVVVNEAAIAAVESEAAADEEIASEETAGEAPAAVEGEEADTSAAMTDTLVITATDDFIIAATITDTEQILVGTFVAENIAWYALRYMDSTGEVVDTLADSTITAFFSAGTVSGSTTCSNYTGRYTADEQGALTIELTAIAPSGTTPESCADGGELNVQEADYLAALSRAATYEAGDSTMDVSDEEGTVVIHYEVTEAN